jgi:hypothetical protein
MCREGDHENCVDLFRYEPYCPCGCALAIPGRLPDFDGDTYAPDLDWERLGNQLKRVIEVMRDRKWRTLDEIQDITGDRTQSISARLRDLRKEKFGRHSVIHRRRGEPRLGIWEYRLLLRVRRP